MASVNEIGTVSVSVSVSLSGIGIVTFRVIASVPSVRRQRSGSVSGMMDDSDDERMQQVAMQNGYDYEDDDSHAAHIDAAHGDHCDCDCGCHVSESESACENEENIHAADPLHLVLLHLSGHDHPYHPHHECDVVMNGETEPACRSHACSAEYGVEREIGPVVVAAFVCIVHPCRLLLERMRRVVGNVYERGKCQWIRWYWVVRERCRCVEVQLLTAAVAVAGAVGCWVVAWVALAVVPDAPRRRMSVGKRW